jgi:hypothetical protein
VVRLAQVETLPIGASQKLERLKLFASFDVFSDRFDVERFTQADHSAE